MWDDFKIEPTYLKKMGRNENDTMLILTKDKLIYIYGQYGWLPTDTIIIPYSGEFGINYEIFENKNYHLSLDTIITLGNQQFIKKQNVDYQWWSEILPGIRKLGKGSVIVSGP